MRQDAKNVCRICPLSRVTGDWGLGILPKLSRPLERGRAKGAGWMCRVAAPFYVAESMPSVPDVLPSIPHFPFLILQNSASSRQSIPCPSGTPFFKGERVLRLFQNSAALLIFMRRTTISHFSFLISNSKSSMPQKPLTHCFPSTSAITRLSSFISIGFATWAFMPSARAFALSSAKALAVMAMMGIFESCGSSRRRMMVVAL